MESERRLAAIMFTDIVGYTSLSQRDEALALRLLEEHRKILRPFFPKYNGKEIKTIGDSFLVEFASALEATRCALDIQRKLHDGSSTLPSEHRVALRIGIHLGDVIHTMDRDVQGDAVNVASRIEPLADPGGICVSDQVYAQIKNKIEYPILKIGSKLLKNIEEPMEVYRIVLPWEEVSSHSTASGRNRLVVLPFKSMSPDPDDEYFADGMTEELITALSGIAGLDVIARTTAMHYRDGSKRASVIGKELDVRSLIEGSVRKAGDKVRISVQLVRAQDESHMWAQNYNKRLNDIFAVQSDIAKRVARTLRVRLLEGDGQGLGKKTPPNVEAYTLYLRGMYLWNKVSREANREAIDCFQRAVEVDPSFAPGFAGLARCHILNADLFPDERVSDFKKARALVLKALEIDDKLAEAHMWQARILWRNDYDLKRGEEEIRKAIELKPSYAEAHLQYAGLLLFQQRMSDAYKEAMTVADLDPLSIFGPYALASYFSAVRDYDRAIEHLKKGLEMAPDNPLLHLFLFRIYCLKHMYNEALGEFKQTSNVSMGRPEDAKWALLAAYTYLGKVQEVRNLLPSSDGQIDQFLRRQPFIIGIAYVRLNEIDKAFEWLEKAVDEADPFFTIVFPNGEELDSLRSDPRYHALLRKVNLE